MSRQYTRTVDARFFLQEMERRLKGKEISVHALDERQRKRILIITGAWPLPIKEIAEEAAAHLKVTAHGRQTVDELVRDNALRSTVYHSVAREEIARIDQEITSLAKQCQNDFLLEEEPRRFIRNGMILSSYLLSTQPVMVLYGAGFNFILPEAISVRFTAEDNDRANFFDQSTDLVRRHDESKESYIMTRYGRSYNSENDHTALIHLSLTDFQTTEELIDACVHLALAVAHPLMKHGQ